MTEFKEEHHYELRKFSSAPFQNEVLTPTSEHPYSADHFERKLQANIYPSEKSLEKLEEEFIPLTKSDREKLHSDFEKNIFEMKAMKKHISAIIAKLHDKSNKKIEKNLQPMSFQITDLSYKQNENIQN